jgi:hypothetical protein
VWHDPTKILPEQVELNCCDAGIRLLTADSTCATLLNIPWYDVIKTEGISGEGESMDVFVVIANMPEGRTSKRKVFSFECESQIVATQLVDSAKSTSIKIEHSSTPALVKSCAPAEGYPLDTHLIEPRESGIKQPTAILGDNFSVERVDQEQHLSIDWPQTQYSSDLNVSSKTAVHSSSTTVQVHDYGTTVHSDSRPSPSASVLLKFCI